MWNNSILVGSLTYIIIGITIAFLAIFFNKYYRKQFDELSKGDEDTPYASLGGRIVAVTIDCVPVLIIIFCVYIFFTPPRWMAQNTGKPIMCWIAVYIYFVLAESFMGATIGKKAAHIRVTNSKNKHPNILAAAVRNFFKLLTVFALAELWYMAEFNKDAKIAFHDIISGTKVIDETKIK